MARPLRIEFEGALYHLTGRGNARQKIFGDEADCAKFVQLLVESLERYEVALHGYGWQDWGLIFTFDITFDFGSASSWICVK